MKIGIHSHQNSKTAIWKIISVMWFGKQHRIFRGILQTCQSQWIQCFYPPLSPPSTHFLSIFLPLAFPSISSWIELFLTKTYFRSYFSRAQPSAACWQSESVCTQTHQTIKSSMRVLVTAYHVCCQLYSAINIFRLRWS